MKHKPHEITYFRSSWSDGNAAIENQVSELAVLGWILSGIVKESYHWLFNRSPIVTYWFTRPT